MQPQLARKAVQQVAAAHHGALEAEVDERTAAGAAAEMVGLRIVSVDDRDAGGRQRVIDACVLRRHFLDAAHELEMLALRVVDQRDGRRGEHGQLGDFAAVIHAELDRSPAVLGSQTEQRQRHADVVVQVAGGGQYRRFAGVLAQDRGDHFLHRGLAVRAGDGDEDGRKARAPAARELAERALGIGDDDHRQGEGTAVVSIDHRRRGAARGGGGKKIVTIETLAA